MKEDLRTWARREVAERDRQKSASYSRAFVQLPPAKKLRRVIRARTPNEVTLDDKSMLLFETLAKFVDLILEPQSAEDALGNLAEIFSRRLSINPAGGVNSLTITSTSTITGNVAAFSAADTLALGGATNGTFNIAQIGGQYQNFGAFQKTGASAWTLTGTNAAALPWTVNGGTLQVDATIANSTMTVNGGGTLAGTGTVGATTINSGGAFMPGAAASPGASITVAGNLALRSGANYSIYLNPATSTFANVAGSASLAGSVSANFASGSYLSRKYTILTATGGLGGTTFGSLIDVNLPSGFTTNLSYDADDAFLNLTAILGAPSTIGLSGLSRNQQNVANAVNNSFNGGATLPPSFVSLFGLSGGNLANALTASRSSSESARR
jgi:autotransporter-associated beta strand protein